MGQAGGGEAGYKPCNIGLEIKNCQMVAQFVGEPQQAYFEELKAHIASGCSQCKSPADVFVYIKNKIPPNKRYLDDLPLPANLHQSLQARIKQDQLEQDLKAEAKRIKDESIVTGVCLQCQHKFCERVIEDGDYMKMTDTIRCGLTVPYVECSRAGRGNRDPYKTTRCCKCEGKYEEPSQKASPKKEAADCQKAPPNTPQKVPPNTPQKAPPEKTAKT